MRLHWLIAGLLAVASSFATADGRFYGELQLGVGGVRHSELDFFPSFGSATAGVYVLPNIGIEIFGDLGLSSGESDGFRLELEGAEGIAARFQSPPSRGIQGYIVLGYVSYLLEQRSSPTGALASSSVDETFRGVRASVGLMQRLVRFPNLQITAEYRHYNADEPLRLDALVLGLRFNTP